MNAIRVGIFSIVALLSTGEVVAWGSNANGQIARPELGSALLKPTTVPNLNNATDVYLGYYHSLAMIYGTTAVGFGSNEYGQLV